MPVRGRMTFNTEPMLAALRQAEQDIDQAVIATLERNKWGVLMMMHDTLRASSETWTKSTARTLFCNGPVQDGNFIYLELGADTGADPAGWYKEFGRPNQAPEPFLRPTLAYIHRRGLRDWLTATLRSMGLEPA